MNIFGRISAFFIANKKLSFLILIITFLWGIISFSLMPKQYNPDIVAPSFAINVEFPNATVDEVYRLVTQPLENVLVEIPGIEDIYSKSYHGGRSSVIVQFYVGEDMEESMITLRQKLSSRINLSPVGAKEPYISTIDPEDLPIKTYALYSDKLSPLELRKRAFQLKDELKLVEGTSILDIVGGRKHEISIVLDPELMEATNSSLNEIEQALSRTSILGDLGQVKSESNYYKLEMREHAATVDEIKDIIIASNFQNQLRVKDIATVGSSLVERESYVNFTSKNKTYHDVVYLAVSKQKGTNVVKVSKALDKKLSILRGRRDYFKDLNVEVVKDEGRTASEEIGGLIKNLFQAIFIVFLILFAFLNHRAAMIVAFSIPMTLLTVFGIGNLLGYTINRITLFALILSLGMLVDSATVVVENIVRLKKLKPTKAKENMIPEAVAEIGTGLLFSTLTTVLAFIPMSFVTGMMGPYMGPVPFFVSTALIVSLIFAYTLNPWLAYSFCCDELKSDLDNKCGVLCSLLKQAVQKYKEMLSTLLGDRKKRLRFLSLCFCVLLIALSLPVVKLLRFRMLPKADREQIYVQIDLERGVSLLHAQTVADKAVEVLMKNNNLLSIQTFTAESPVLDFNGLFRGVSERNQKHNITLKLNLTHPDTRKLASEDIAFSCRELLLKEFQDTEGLNITLVEDPPGPPVKSTFQLKLKSTNPDLLHSAAKIIEQEAASIDGVEDIDSSILAKNHKYLLYVDKTEAAKVDVDVASITNELETVFKGRNTAVYHSDYNYEQEYIAMRFARDIRDDISDLDKITVANTQGLHIPLSRFVKVVSAVEEDVYLNDNRERTVYISGEMAKRSVTYAAIDYLRKLKNLKIPGYDLELRKFSILSAEFLVNAKDELRVEIGGEWDLTMKVFRDLGMAMLVALILIYLVLVAQFRSFIVPALIFVTIPLALIGVLPGFALLFAINRIYFSATSMIGVIALSGIVVNNAIIFVEHLRQSINEFDNLKDLLIDAGLTRMRPILLTSVTTILGSLVIASDPVWSGLAWSIVFGLSLSSLLTLVVFPCLVYHFLNKNWKQVLNQ